MTKAVFLDRDGVINRHVHHLSKVSELRLLPGAGKAIRMLNKAGFLAIVLTNQGGAMGRGLLDEETLDEIHAVLIRRLGSHGARLDAIYHCPHHPQASVRRYRYMCACRKPNVGMINKALKKFKVNLKGSYLVGDMSDDIAMGNRRGVRTILVKTGFGGKDGRYPMKPDVVVSDLGAAARFIIGHEKRGKK